MKILLSILLFCTSLIAQVPATPVNLTIGTQPSTGGNLYCTKQGTWIGATADGPAAMPQHCMYTGLDNVVFSGVTRGPDSTTATLQADINAANCGDVILVVIGANIGTISLPPKMCDSVHFVFIKSTGASDPTFPAEGTRLTPCALGIASMPGRSYPCTNPKLLTFNIITPASSNGIVSPNGGDHYRIVGANITRVSTTGVPVYSFVDLTASSTQVNNIVFDRDAFSGIENTFPITAQTLDTSTTRAINLAQSNHIAVIDSYFTNFYDTGSMSANGQTDAQCISGGFGSIPNSGWGAYKFVNNHCEASGEGILLGGSGGPALTPVGCTIMVNCNQDMPSDLEVRQNYFLKPLQWNGNTTVVNTVGWPVVKNGFEMKTGARGFFEANVVENCWYSAQGCGTFNVAPVNQQSGGITPTATCPTCGVRDFIYRYNYSYNVAYGIAVYSFTPTTCSTCQSQGMDRVSIHDNVIGDNMNLGSLTNTSSGDAIELLADNDPTGRGLNKTQNLNISHNTFVKSIRSLTLFGGPTSNAQIVNLVMRDNLWSYGNFGFVSVGNTGGCDTVSGGSFFNALNNCVSTWTVDHNAEFNVVGTLGHNWPTDGTGANNFFFSGVSTVGFSNYGTGNSGFNPSNYKLLSTSPLHNKASDGKDVGADINAVITATQGVRN